MHTIGQVTPRNPVGPPAHSGPASVQNVPQFGPFQAISAQNASHPFAPPKPAAALGFQPNHPTPTEVQNGPPPDSVGPWHRSLVLPPGQRVMWAKRAGSFSGRRRTWSMMV